MGFQLQRYTLAWVVSIILSTIMTLVVYQCLQLTKLNSTWHSNCLTVCSGQAHISQHMLKYVQCALGIVCTDIVLVRFPNCTWNTLQSTYCLAQQHISKLPTDHSVSDMIFISTPSAPLGVLRTAVTQSQLNMMVNYQFVVLGLMGLLGLLCLMGLM